MTNKLILTFEDSQEDIPVLIVGHEAYSGALFGSTIVTDKVITGDEAVGIWKDLTVKKKAANEGSI